MRGIFVPGRMVDFNQDVVVQVLLNEHKVNANRIEVNEVTNTHELRQSVNLDLFRMETANVWTETSTTRNICFRTLRGTTGR